MRPAGGGRAPQLLQGVAPGGVAVAEAGPGHWPRHRRPLVPRTHPGPPHNYPGYLRGCILLGHTLCSPTNTDQENAW